MKNEISLAMNVGLKFKLFGGGIDMTETHSTETQNATKQTLEQTTTETSTWSCEAKEEYGIGLGVWQWVTGT